MAGFHELDEAGLEAIPMSSRCKSEDAIGRAALLVELLSRCRHGSRGFACREDDDFALCRRFRKVLRQAAGWVGALHCSLEHLEQELPLLFGVVRLVIHQPATPLLNAPA